MAISVTGRMNDCWGWAGLYTVHCDVGKQRINFTFWQKSDAKDGRLTRYGGWEGHEERSKRSPDMHKSEGSVGKSLIKFRISHASRAGDRKYRSLGATSPLFQNAEWVRIKIEVESRRGKKWLVSGDATYPLAIREQQRRRPAKMAVVGVRDLGAPRLISEDVRRGCLRPVQGETSPQ